VPHGSYSLGEAAATLDMLRLECAKCGRAGRYRIDRLIERYGSDIALPDLRHELAQCRSGTTWAGPVPGGVCQLAGGPRAGFGIVRRRHRGDSW
jgi:hypothetical protein